METATWARALGGMSMEFYNEGQLPGSMLGRWQHLSSMEETEAYWMDDGDW